MVCVADATNLRLVLRLVLELKQVGRPMVLALNMYDIAQRQGLRIDLERPVGARLGAPIVTTVATRKRGIEDLVAKVDALVDGRTRCAPTTSGASRPPPRSAPPTARPSASSRPTSARPSAPTPVTGKVDAVLLHPVGRPG